MRISTVTSLLALTTFSTALQLSQSRPFALVILSQNKTYNNKTLIPCAKGKGGPFPGLCPLAPLGYPLTQIETFNLNYTSNPTLGYLTYEIQNKQTSSGLVNFSAPMAFNKAESYRVPVFGTVGVEGATKIVFDERGYLGVPDGGVSIGARFDRWFVCEISGGGVYESVVWSEREGVPGLSGCVGVEVGRVFG